MSKRAACCVLYGLAGAAGLVVAPYAQAADTTHVGTGKNSTLQGISGSQPVSDSENASHGPVDETKDAALQSTVNGVKADNRHNQPGSGAAQAGPVTDADLYGQMRIQAGQYAAQNMHQILVGDFTCDGQPDRIAGWVDHDNPDGPFFDVLFVTRNGGTLSSEMKLIPFAQDKQFALCIADDTAPPPMSWQQVEPDYVRDVVGNANLCTTAVRIEDFICDTPQFYWNNTADKKGDHWVFYRN
ncbi:hypothetical protein [Thalassospira mesophila]|uniref:hypothetical protein n=1 Tax=Thalassospira mesophila TaxID=1293891 RepID=UPI000A1DDD8D|nr:hypothetical protein [Thalassospira mesophila]